MWVNEIADLSDWSDTGVEANYADSTGGIYGQIEHKKHVPLEQMMATSDRLVGEVAHDINNILQSIVGFSGILLDGLDEGTQQYDDVSEIRQAAHRACGLTRKLFPLNRKHCGDHTVQDLNKIVRMNENMVGRLIGEHIEVVYDLQQNLKQVCVDESQVGRIILNLLINARDAMPEGGRLLVSTYNVDPEEIGEPDWPSIWISGYICLEIMDTGCGIHKDVLNNLFEPFFTTKPIGEGSGLGLSVVHGIVQQYGGRIDVSSCLAEGSVFKVYLPTWNPDSPGPAEVSDILEGGRRLRNRN